MQGWTRTITNSTHDELRRVRKELARAGATPLRVIVAGDPAKPLISFTIPRRAPLVFVCAFVLGALAVSLTRDRSTSTTASSLQTEALPPPTNASPQTEVQPPSVWQDKVGAVARDPIPESVQPSRSASPPPSASPPRSASPPTLEPSDPSNPPPRPNQPSTSLTLEIANTGKVVHLKLLGLAHEPDESSYRVLRHELRCRRSGAEYPIDPRLTELLYRISAHTGERIQVVSAYRAPVHAGDFNFHARGMAADIRVPGMSTADLRDLAQSLGARGIGYYPTVQFVHVDVRDVPFSWTDTSGHGDQPPRYESPGVPEPIASAALAGSAAPSAAALASPTSLRGAEPPGAPTSPPAPSTGPKSRPTQEKSK